MPKEVTVPVRQVERRLQCDCGGWITFVPFGDTRETLVEHRCDKCRETSWQEKSYPELAYEAIS